jgi:hypothetical protein
MCNAGDVVIGGYMRAQGVTNLSGDHRFADTSPIGPARGSQMEDNGHGQTSAPDFRDAFAVWAHSG